MYFPRAIALIAALLLPVVGQAESGPSSADRQIEALAQTLDAEFQALQLLTQQTEESDVLDHQALVFRQDDRSFALLGDADQLALALAELPEGSATRKKFTQKLSDDLSHTDARVFQRVGELDRQIAESRRQLDGLSAGARISSEAYLQSLESVRFQYYEALINHYQSRQLLGLALTESRSRLTRMIHLHAEALAGQIEFDSAARDDVENRLSQDPTNSDIQLVLSNLNVRHSEALEQLAVATELLNRLEVDTSDYTALLLQQSQGVSVGLFQSGVIDQLLATWMDTAWEALVEHMPNILLKLAIFLLVLMVSRYVSRLVRRIVRASCERSSLGMSMLLKDILVSASGGTVMILGVLMALSQIGITLGPMLAGLGVAGFVIGFALQDTLGNFAAGAMILIYRPYDVDDFVEVTGASGLVKKMSLVSTTITTFDNQTLVIPNSKIWGDVIKNVTAQKLRRVDLEFGIGYNDDIEKTERVLADILDSHALVLKKPEPLIKLNSLGESSVNFAVRPWTKTENYWDVYWDLTREVKLRFDREGISIPFPQRDVHLFKDD
jgi:small conductance mechanosensitive channel